MHNLQITAELTPDLQEGGYSAYCPEFEIYSQGDTAEEAARNLKEAVTGYIKVVGIDEALKVFKAPIRKMLELTIP